MLCLPKCYCSVFQNKKNGILAVWEVNDTVDFVLFGCFQHLSTSDALMLAGIVSEDST